MKNLRNFKWHGIDKQGYRVKGSCAAINCDEVKVILRQEHIIPIKIKSPFKFNVFSANKISYNDITLFAREMATLIAAGIPLLNALDIIEKSSQKEAMQKLIHSLKTNIKSGHLFSQTLKDHGHYFDPLFSSLIFIGEQSGNLDKVLLHISAHREKFMSLRQKIKKVLFYPMTVLVIALLITFGLLIFVVPQFQKLFNSVGAPLPFLTRCVISCTNQLTQHAGLLSLMLISVVLILHISWKKSVRFRYNWQSLILKIPFVGNSIMEAIFARCFRMLAMTLSAGLPLMDALAYVAQISDNVIHEQAWLTCAKHIKAGHGLHSSLEQLRFFPSRVVQMLAIGEQSGCIDTMLIKLADYFEQQVDYVIHNLSQLLEPAIMIFLSLVVGVLVIAMYLPIFRLGSVV